VVYSIKQYYKKTGKGQPTSNFTWIKIFFYLLPTSSWPCYCIAAHNSECFSSFTDLAISIS